jgi:phage terminase large subunit GpA-like protein
MSDNYLLQTIPQLTKLRETVPAAQGVAITKLIEAVSEKKPIPALKRIDLTKYEKNFLELSKLTIKELTQTFKKDLHIRPIIDILIIVYIRYASETKLIWSKQAPAVHVNKYLNQDKSFLRSQNQLKPIHQPKKLISEYVNGLRIMPAGSPYPGIYDIYKTPHVIEIVDNMSPYSECRNCAVKKSVQNAFTTGVAENVIAYYIGERPTKILYMTGTNNLLSKFVKGRLQPLIDSCGFQKLIFSQSTKKHNRNTGDTATYKEFIGGSLTLGSFQSSADMRQESSQIALGDEIDLIESQMHTGEGNPLDVRDGRLEAYGDRGKTMDFSTPREYGNSLIDIQHDRGDQRKYMVACPMCGKHQYLSQGDEKSNYGLKGDYTAGRLVQGYYLCYHCHDAIFEPSKNKMLANGYWLPSISNPPDKHFRSYHSPAFYSPSGMISWTKMRKKYDKAEKEGDDGMRSYTNLYLAESFEPTGERPDIKSVIEIRSKYKSGTVPAGILYLSMAADVQRGADKWKKYTNEQIHKLAYDLTKKKDWKKLNALKLPRLEVEVIGHGKGYRTASIIYKKFYGQVTDHTSGAWKLFSDWRNETPEGLRFKREDGYPYPVGVIFIDSGWNPSEDLTNTVYNYCQPWGMTYAIKGTGTYKQDKLKMNDITTHKSSDIQRFKLTKSGEHPLVLIHGNYYKRWIYTNFKNSVTRVNDQPANTHITPADYPDSYFEALRAEKQKTNGDFHNPARKPNEALDLLVYNKAAFDFIVFNEILRLQEIAKHKNPNLALRLKKNDLAAKEKLKEVANYDIVIANMEEMLRRNAAEYFK